MGMLDISRVIDALDGCYKRNDLAGAARLAEYWAKEAEKANDGRSELSVRNEMLGLYRRTNDAEKGLNAVERALRLLDITGIRNHLSGAAVLVNAATTLSAFGKSEEALPLYQEAKQVFVNESKTEKYEYAALLNNQATALNRLKRYDEAESAWREAIEILRKEGTHDGEIAVSLVNLAHLIFDRDENAYEQIEKTLDEAWEYLNSDRFPRDGNYAFILSKCAPSFDYFQRPEAAQALRDVAEEIYSQR